jgi:putative ABC transport system permease protein
MKDMKSSVDASPETEPVQNKQYSKLSAYAALWEAFNIAIDSIWSHKMRSILTLLGIIIGVAAVVTVGAAIEGLGYYISSSLEGVLGSNTFTVTRIAGATSYEDYLELIKKNKPIRLEEMNAVEERCEGCYAISPNMGRNDTVKRGNLVFDDANIRGISEDFPKIQDLELAGGRFFSSFDVSHATSMAVIGSQIRDELFGSVDPLGKDIRISGDRYKVIGVEVENGGMMGNSMDTNIYIPYPTFLKKYGTRQSIAFRVKASSDESYADTQDEVRQIMRVQRKLKPNQDDNFSIFASQEIQDTIGQITGLITVAVIPVVAISMVVGAIVVMNIMLVVVTERTMEIGMRKSLGARKKDILLQFLVESALLALLGGVIGVLLAYCVSTIIKMATPMPMYVTFTYIAFAILSSGGIGVISGLYPAYRAAKLDPIVALTRE